MRLSHTTAAGLPETVLRPAPLNPKPRRIVHLGIGAFHRAHQAVYTQDAGNDWRITGVSMRSVHVRDALVPQDGLYTIHERFSGRTAMRLITVLDTVLVAPDEPEAVVGALADPDTHVVTLTVTEKGYYRRPVDGALDRDNPVILGDLHGGEPKTIYGFLAQAFSRRRAAGTAGVTLLSCDNMPGNGRLLMRLLSEFLDAVDADLALWARSHVVAPDTMVDRIVPASTSADRAEVQAAIGMEDAASIVTEPFRQWVIANRFAGPRPNWESAGVKIVSDVAPFELAKLRLLNASHSTLAYIGLQLGYAHVHEAIADPLLRNFVIAQMRREAVPSLSKAPGLDPEAYIEAIIERFANADLHHRLEQIALDGSQKLQQRWIGTIDKRLAEGLASPLHLASVAAWIAYTRSEDMADDPLFGRYRSIWQTTKGEPAAVVERFVTDLGLFPDRICQSPSCTTTMINALALIRAVGPRAVLAQVCE